MSNSYYRPDHITAVSTHSTISCSALKADGCEHCHAPYGHYIQCPTINRVTREAHATLSEADDIRLNGSHGAGVSASIKAECEREIANGRKAGWFFSR